MVSHEKKLDINIFISKTHEVNVSRNRQIVLDINRIGGVMLSALASRAVYRVFEPQSGQTNDFKIGICCFSAKHAA